MQATWPLHNMVITTAGQQCDVNLGGAAKVCQLKHFPSIGVGEWLICHKKMLCPVHQPGSLQCVILGAKKNSNSPENLCAVPANADASLPHYCRLRHAGIQSTLGRLVKSLLWSRLSWIKWFSVRHWAVVRQLIHIQKPWTEQGWSMFGVQNPQMPISFGFSFRFNSQHKSKMDVCRGKSYPWGSVNDGNSIYQHVHLFDTKQRQTGLLDM